MSQAETLFIDALAEHNALGVVMGRELRYDFARLSCLAHQTLAGGGRLLFFGNGGSAADCQHIATEFSVRFKNNRHALPALALTASGAELTAIGNDYGFENIFARQIEAHGRPGDLAIGLTTSGKSPNVLIGLQKARVQGLKTAALTGQTGGYLHGATDAMLRVPSPKTARIQEMHLFLGHCLCEAIEVDLGLNGKD